MTKLLIKLFIKNSENVDNPKVRQSYGILGGAVGIFCNALLFIAKFIVGILTSSVAIMADAFNNLSDAASSVVTIVGFKISGKPADKEHPFGHGRVEYICGLIISMVIILMGFEFIKSSIEKILSPQDTSLNAISAIILVLSILLKLWLGVFNHKLGKIINSATMKATAMESLSDVIATIAVLIGMVITYITEFNVDGYSGLIVALFIFYTGFTTAKETLNPLLGEAPDPDFVKRIKSRVLECEEVVGIHDLVVHNYGPLKSMISLHAEVPCDADILKTHDAIDLLERSLKKEFCCEAIIHMDPIATDDEAVSSMKAKISDLVKGVNKEMTIHDFRMVTGPTHTNLIFDVTIPHNISLGAEDAIEKISDLIKKLNPTYQAIINIDREFF